MKFKIIISATLFFRLFLVSRAYTNWEMLQMYMVLSYIVCVVDFEQLKNATLCLKVQYSVRTGWWSNHGRGLFRSCVLFTISACLPYVVVLLTACTVIHSLSQCAGNSAVQRYRCAWYEQFSVNLTVLKVFLCYHNALPEVDPREWEREWIRRGVRRRGI